MNREELTRASCYEELELLLTLQALQGKRHEVFNKLNNYQDDIAFCIPTKTGFVWYSKKSLKRIEAPQEISGDFGCAYWSSLTSLKGAPKDVSGNFNCSNCASLTSLEGAPEKVGGGFRCYKCTSLISLKGAPDYIGGDFYCFECPNLHSLDGIGKVGGRIFRDY